MKYFVVFISATFYKRSLIKNVKNSLSFYKLRAQIFSIQDHPQETTDKEYGTQKPRVVKLEYHYFVMLVFNDFLSDIALLTIF